MPEDPESDMTPETSLQFEYGSNGAGQSDTVTNVANVAAVTKMAENEITNQESHSLPTTPPQKIERIDTNFNQSAMSDINQLTRKDFKYLENLYDVGSIRYQNSKAFGAQKFGPF